MHKPIIEMNEIFKYLKNRFDKISYTINPVLLLLAFVKIDFVLPIILSYAYKFFVVLLSPVNGVYYSADYIVFIALIFCIVLRIKIKSYKTANIILLLVSVISLISIETFNYYYRGAVLNDLDLFRHVLFNPLIMPIINFILYGIYLGLTDDSIRIKHARMCITTISYFGLFYVIFWNAVYFSIFPSDGVEKNNYLNNNYISYACLLSAYCTLKFNENLNFNKNKRWLIYVISVTLILLNTTRGAMVCAIFYAFIYITNNINGMRRNIFRISGVLMLIAGLIAVSNFLYFSDRPSTTHWKLYDAEIFDELIDEVKNVHINLKNISVIEINRDSDSQMDGVISSASRIFTNFIGLLYFAEYPITGVGSALAYSIKLFGEGIHSFIFLYIASFGILGSLVLAISIRYIYRLLYPLNQIDIGGLVNAIIFSVPILIFVNNLPIYLIILIYLEAKHNVCGLRRSISLGR